MRRLEEDTQMDKKGEETEQVERRTKTENGDVKWAGGEGGGEGGSEQKNVLASTASLIGLHL